MSACRGSTYDLYAGSNKVTSQAASQANVAATTAIINDEFRQTMLTGDLALIPTTITPTAAASSATNGRKRQTASLNPPPALRSQCLIHLRSC